MCSVTGRFESPATSATVAAEHHRPAAMGQGAKIKPHLAYEITQASLIYAPLLLKHLLARKPANSVVDD